MIDCKKGHKTLKIIPPFYNIPFFVLQLWGCLWNVWGQRNIRNIDTSKGLKKSLHIEFLPLLLFLETTAPCEKAHTKEEDDEKPHGKRLAFPAEALLNQPDANITHKCESSRAQPYYQDTDNKQLPRYLLFKIYTIPYRYIDFSRIVFSIWIILGIKKDFLKHILNGKTSSID